VWIPLVLTQIPDTMKARSMTEEQVKRHVLLAESRSYRLARLERIPVWSNRRDSQRTSNERFS
jgi:3-hydroxybutyrate dehydrogenase